MDNNDQQTINGYKHTILKLKKPKTEEDKLAKYNAHFNLLKIYKERKVYQEGKENGLEALKITKKLKDKFTRFKNTAKTNEILGDLSSQIQDYSTSKKYYNNALKNYQLARSEVAKFSSPESKKEDYWLQFDFFNVFFKLNEIIKKVEGKKNALRLLEKKWLELFKKDKKLESIQGMARVSHELASYYLAQDDDELFWEYLAQAYILNKLILQLNKIDNEYWSKMVDEIENLFEKEGLKILEIKEEKNEVGVEILEAISQLDLSNKDLFHINNILTARENNLRKKDPEKYLETCKKADSDVSSALRIFINSEKIIALLEKGEFNEAIDLNHKTIKDLSRIKINKFKIFFNGLLYLNLARIHYKKNDKSAERFARKALTFFQKDITADNHACITLLELGYFLIQQKRYSVSKKCFEEVIGLKGGGNLEIWARTFEGLSQSEFNLLNFEKSFINASKAALIYNMIPEKKIRYELNLSNSMNIFIEYLKSIGFLIQI
ncbi:MAG: hypothetical protein ACTSX4_09410 [Candidatus Helarchaeota archaeon]